MEEPSLQQNETEITIFRTSILYKWVIEPQSLLNDKSWECILNEITTNKIGLNSTNTIIPIEIRFAYNKNICPIPFYITSQWYDSLGSSLKINPFISFDGKEGIIYIPEDVNGGCVVKSNIYFLPQELYSRIAGDPLIDIFCKIKSQTKETDVLKIFQKLEDGGVLENTGSANLFHIQPRSLLGQMILRIIKINNIEQSVVHDTLIEVEINEYNKLKALIIDSYKLFHSHTIEMKNSNNLSLTINKLDDINVHNPIQPSSLSAFVNDDATMLTLAMENKFEVKILMTLVYAILSPVINFNV